MELQTMAEKKIETGLFGGSFNPIHIGHLALANYLCEFNGLDELWFLVSPHNPLKEHADLLDDAQRLELARLAIDGYPRFKVSDIEFQLPRPSYTIHTLEKLKETYPDHQFYLIIGSDNWKVFNQWYKHEYLLKENPILIYPRPGFPIEPASLPENVQWVDAPLLDVSSTFIRESIREGKDIRFFLPQSVYQMITDKKLYQ